MRRFYRKLAFNYSEGGLGGLLQKALSFASNSLYSETCWNIYISSFSELDPAEPLVQCKELKFQDLLDAQYAKVMAFPEEIHLRFQKQNTCYGFYWNNSLAVVGWSSYGYLELDHGVVFPCPSEVALFDFLTLPEFRGRGLYTNALRYLVRKFDRQGARTAYIAVDPNNTHSLKGIQGAGFSPLICVRRRRFMGFAFISQAPAKLELLARKA